MLLEETRNLSWPSWRKLVNKWQNQTHFKLLSPPMVFQTSVDLAVSIFIQITVLHAIFSNCDLQVFLKSDELFSVFLCKSQMFPAFNFDILRICSFSLFYMINWISLCFGLLFRQSKQLDDVILGFSDLWCTFFTILQWFYHFRIWAERPEKSGKKNLPKP